MSSPSREKGMPAQPPARPPASGSISKMTGPIPADDEDPDKITEITYNRKTGAEISGKTPVASIVPGTTDAGPSPVQDPKNAVRIIWHRWLPVPAYVINTEPLPDDSEVHVVNRRDINTIAKLTQVMSHIIGIPSALTPASGADDLAPVPNNIDGKPREADLIYDAQPPQGKGLKWAPKVDEKKWKYMWRDITDLEIKVNFVRSYDYSRDSFHILAAYGHFDGGAEWGKMDLKHVGKIRIFKRIRDWKYKLLHADD
ncbi:hypothetical protein FN846DRAFT_906849 [Sphaerosporella brunnea]|uniref:Uncharacterized protein n=1 Tax=Sphaerosporella brunnea TaxID=1250544 RepID=A0A5J5EXX5_9PEZI|nr:hypothetical protein FN846DRAFT_906849 [Sphaerosporella brunnea]